MVVSVAKLRSSHVLMNWRNAAGECHRALGCINSCVMIFAFSARSRPFSISYLWDLLSLFEYYFSIYLFIALYRFGTILGLEFFMCNWLRYSIAIKCRIIQKLSSILMAMNLITVKMPSFSASDMLINITKLDRNKKVENIPLTSSIIFKFD